MVDYLLLGKATTEYSRLSSYVVTGVLESLVEATPSRLGHTSYISLSTLVHPEEAGTSINTSLTESVLRDIRWWHFLLSNPGGRVARSARSETLMLKWGDGIGTGAGGTLGWLGTLVFANDPLQIWMGK
jgi:hypothetical protein